MVLEPCNMVFRDWQDRPRGLCQWHVDDFLVAGKPDDPVFQEEFEAIRNMYEWSDWESGSFLQTGLQMKQHKDMSFTMDQSII